MSVTDHPFQPGARVAINSRWSDDVAEDFVLKVHKSGNFTLRGRPDQQWRPWKGSYDTATWRATATGGGFHRASLQIWDATTDAEISKKNDRARLLKRFEEVRNRIRAIKALDVTEEMVAALEAACPKEKAATP